MHRERSLHQVLEKNFQSHSDDHAHIYCKHYYPIGKLPNKFIHVIFQHGLIEYHHRHEDLFDALRNHFGKNLVISTMDLYGHGLSGGDRAFIDTFDTFVKDMQYFFQDCYDLLYEDSEVETFMIAHSLGGLITIKTLSQELTHLPFSIKGLVLTNPCIAPKIELPAKVVKIADHIPDAVSKVKIPLIYDAYDLSHDEDKAISFMHDHLISKSVTIKLGVEIINATKSVNSLSYFFNFPTLFILSDDDRLVDIEKVELFLTGMDKSLTQKKRYPKMRHDILNETCRSDVFREIIKYIEGKRV